VIRILFLIAGLAVHKVADTNGDLPLTVPFLGGVVAENQAHFNSYSYMVGIADALDKAGVPIYENSRVISVKYDLSFADQKVSKRPLTPS
jgi:glycine/D-amino acid oxidase-like deaminating enzyme